ncbi:Crp/Fnr family transcriptional regulator [Candidatus Endoriftia persephone]|jgi:CRP-like cAMP-binding protein|nr:Crp/Fnr family transcriptional regulator [Candidatus Endoriftia persephone]USF88946.1 Crp/Fnr family transcriptional regulator [Candidatus Endoriftia persephone]
MDIRVTVHPHQTFISKCDPFNGLAQEILEFLEAGASVLAFKRGQLVYDSGSTSAGFYLVMSGQVKQSIFSADGAERVIRIISRGGAFGASTLFTEQPARVTTYAMLDGEALVLRRALIREAVQTWPEFADRMLRHMSVKLYGLVGDLETCCLKSATQRVASYLAGIAADKSPHELVIEVTLPAPKSVVASTLDLTPETFSRELHRLSANGLIQVSRNRVAIHDLDRLRCLDCRG